MKGCLLPFQAFILWALIVKSGEQISVDNSPRIITNNGNLMFQPGTSKNIQFETQGQGLIKFNDINVLEFYEKVKNVRTFIAQYPNQDRNNSRCDCNAMKITIASNTEKIKTLRRKLKTTNEQMNSMLTLVNDLKQLSTVNECSDNPCHNGGTCVDGFGKYTCICPKQYQGRKCMEDVNECNELTGTDLGCQNNARCVNTIGGFKCICTGKWSGILCNIPTSGCSGSSHVVLCGHGTCISDHSATNTRGFKCLCDNGWNLDPVTQTCINDYNECDAARYPCSEVPRVPCYNTPGGFNCGRCPHGFTGNGFLCTDLNECLSPNICGTNQICINTLGSYTCQCVEGMTFNSNGVCHRTNICLIDNGGCNINAQCTPNSYYSEGRICACNAGYAGNGIGINGCTASSSMNTTNSAYLICIRLQLCRNGGSCRPTLTGFQCQCTSSFVGERCRTQIINRCYQNPCLNGGRCEFLEPNNYLCRCTSYFTGRNCEIEHTECGGTIISPKSSRDITLNVSSSLPISYRYPCVWTILVSNEQFIQVKPIFFQWVESCSQEYVQILERSSSESQPRELGKYCRDNNNALSTGYNTTGPILIIKAQLQHNVLQLHGFTIRITPSNYVSQNVDCCKCLNMEHVITNASSGIFQSPHYPLAYPDGINCIMQYDRMFGQKYRVVISIMTVDLGDSNGNCSNTDFLKITYVERSETKITACNQAAFQNQKFITSGFKIEFYSDLQNSASISRFQLFWRKTVNEDPCGGILNFQNTETIEVQSLSENQEAYCTWNVHKSNTSRMISLKGVFTNWQNGDCSVYIDILTVDLSGNTRLLREQCQSSNMIDNFIEEITGELIIIFRKSMGVSTPSFRINIAYVCGKVINMDQMTSFELKSPNYPDDYDNNLNCIYRFVAKTRKFTITFTDFDVAEEYPCSSDYILITGGSRSFLNRRYCNGNADYLIPVDKEPSDENMEITFVTNSSITGRGFKAMASLYDCGGSYYLYGRLVITYPEDHINDSNSDIAYEKNKNCIWTIISPPGSYILAVFDHFHLEYHRNCNYDSLSVSYDNVTDRKHCGNDIPNIVTRSNKLKLVFKSDHSISGEGFIMRAYVGSIDTHCHQDFVAPEGRILSPPLRSMSRPYICIYSITVPLGRKVVLNITIDGLSQTNLTTNTEFHKCFGKGRLRIKNGLMGSVSMAEICPDNPQQDTIMTSSNKASIIYLVPSYGNNSEFRFTVWFRSIDEECGSIHNDNYGEVASPNYPQYAPRNSYCQWEIHSTPGKQIRIRIIHIKAGSTSVTRDCRDNKNPVIKLISISQEVAISCEMHRDDIYFFNDNVVRIIFKNYENTQYRFRLSYKKVCDISINASSGRIENNNQMVYYPYFCSWKLFVLRGSKLLLQLDQFDLPNSVNGTCKTYLMIMDSKRILMPKSCGNTIINSTFQTIDSPVTIKHYVDRKTPYSILQAHSGFILEYNTQGCIYNINYDPNDLSYFTRNTYERGSISSPQYPNSVSNVDCIWTFKSISGYSIKVTFDVIELDSFYNCSEGSILRARESENVNDPYVFQSCERVTQSSPLIFQSSTNYLFLIFNSANDSNGGQRKFHAKYEFINSSCEYQITATQGIIKSPNYPEPYPVNINCKWSLSVRQGMSIYLQFLDFEVEGSSCRYDYVQLFSTFNSELMPITRLCDHDVNTSRLYQSISNQMLVTFKTDRSVQRRGFKAKFFEGCGGQRNATEENQFLLSPNYPHQYQIPNNICEWTITANISNPGERIFFYFHGFESETGDIDGNCSLNINSQSDNSLIIIDGLDDTPIKARLCSSYPSSPIISSGHFLRVILKSTNGKAIFKAGFGTGSTTCGGEYFLENGIFTSPFYPNAVNMDMDCLYFIQGNPGAEIDLSIDEFARTNDNSYEFHDFLEIKIGNINQNKLFGRYYKLADIQNATTNFRFNTSILIRFRSQGGLYTNAVKFLARYHINYISEFDSDSGAFSSPLFGHLYKADTRRTWTISPLVAQRIDIEFLKFSVGRTLQNNYCSRGKLMITDVNGNSKSLCGSNLPIKETYIPPVSITLVAEGYRYPGFILKWSPTLNESFTKIGDCKYILTATETPQILTSPNFPFFDPINRNCEWTIKAPLDRAIDLRILNFTLEDSINCKYENFTIIRRIYSYYYNVQEKVFCGRQNNSMLDYIKDVIFTSITIKFKVDKFDIFPGFKLQYKLKCYKEINSIEGWLQNKEFPNYITEPINCTYVLQLSADRSYQLNFTHLSLPPETNNQCLNSYLEISMYRKVERYCGSVIPNNLLPLSTNSNVISIRLFGSFDSYSTYRGFQLKYSLTEVEECGGNHILTQPTDQIIISNPRNNSYSPHFIECKWYISAPYGSRMKIDFVYLTIQSNSTCRNSFLSFYDGSTIISKRIGDKNYCFKENSIFTTGNKLLVFFKNLYTLAKFTIQVSLGICGGNLIRYYGSIVSPNYPHNYPKVTSCIWTLTSRYAHSFVINFDDIALNTDCSTTRLLISSLDPAMGFNWSSCVDSPSKLHIMSNKILISFITNGTRTNRGFKLSYRSKKIVCGGTLTDPSGEAKTSNYPASMYQYLSCHWNIQTDITKRITIIIKKLNLRYNCLIIYHIDSSEVRRFCNRNYENYEIDTKYSRVSIYISGEGSRLFFSYNTDQPSLCGTHINPGNNETGVINFEGNNDFFYCRHIFHNFPGDFGTVAFKFVNVTGLTCGMEKIKFQSIVSEGQYFEYIVDKVEFCNNQNINNVIFTTLGKSIDLIYDGSPERNRTNHFISIKYKYQNCGGMMAEPFGYITSPNYPNPYPHHSNCEWIIKAPRNLHIRLVINSLHLEKHAECKYDYLYIRSGPEFNSPVVKQFCGKHNITNETQIYRNNLLRISFKSDHSVARDGFSIQYTFINAVDNCHGFIFKPYGSLKSPNYPVSYPGNIRCNWTIILPRGYQIEVRIQEPFDIEVDRNNACLYDALEIIDSNPNVIIARLCGHIPPRKPFLSSENRIGIQFTTDHNLQLAGFHIKYTSVCGGIFNSTYGIINSPDTFISSTVYKMECSYVIPSWERHLTILSIIPSLNNCRYPYGHVEIWKETQPGTFIFSQKICGISPERIIIMNTLSIMIKYNVTFRGIKIYSFKGTYLHDETVKIYKNFTKKLTIQNPQFPTPYHHNANLQWKFQAPPNYIYFIELLYMDIESSFQGCIYDYVAFYRSNNTNSSDLVEKLCGKRQFPIPFKIESSDITIHFISDSSHFANHTGFSASIIPTPGPQLGCGGFINLNSNSEGFIKSVDLNNDSLYENGLFCEWRLVAPLGYAIQLRFENNSVSMERRSRQTCRYDMLRIYDGPHQGSPLLRTLCGNDSVDPLTSSGFNLFVVFITDSSITKHGFKLHYSTVLSPNNIYVNATTDFQVLTSPGYPDSTPYNFKGRIEIFAPNDSHHIIVEIKELTLRPTVNCSLDSFLISDVSLRYTNQIRKFCKSIQLPIPFISAENGVTALYKVGPQESQDSADIIRYKIQYKIFSCNRTETAYSGRITNIENLKENLYSHNTTCNLTLEAPSSDLTFQFYFKKMVLESSSTCAYDYIQFIFGRPGQQQYALPKMCGSYLPPSLISNSSYVTILFVTDASIAYDGFDITYVVNRNPREKCGGDINTDVGVITSPGYGRNNYESGNCIWNIALLSEKKLSWKITDLELGSNTTVGQACTSTTDYVKISHQSMEWKLCGNILPSYEFEMSTGRITVEYKSESGGTGIGFRLEWKISAIRTP